MVVKSVKPEHFFCAAHMAAGIRRYIGDKVFAENRRNKISSEMLCPKLCPNQENSSATRRTRQTLTLGVFFG